MKFTARLINCNRITVDQRVVEVMGIELGDLLEADVKIVKKSKDIPDSK
jgi:hypothetical protein